MQSMPIIYIPHNNIIVGQSYYTMYKNKEGKWVWWGHWHLKESMTTDHPLEDLSIPNYKLLKLRLISQNKLVEKYYFHNH